MSAERPCTACRVIKPLSEFYRSGGGGRRSDCKACHLRKVRENQRKIAAHYARGRIAAVSGEKLCSRCGRVKPVAEFRADESAADGAAARCRDCQATTQIYEYAARRLRITSANLLDVCDRSERRADMVELGGLRGVHEIRRRIAIVRRAKDEIGGGEVPAERLAELLPS